MALDPNTMIQNLLAGTGYGHTPSDYAAQNQQIASNDQILQINRLKMAAAQQSQADDQQFQQDAADYSQNPTVPKLAAMLFRYPDKAAAIKAGHDALDEPARQSRLGQWSELFYAAKNNNPTLLAKKLGGIITAEKGQGNNDTSEAEELQADLAAGSPDAVNHVLAYAQAQLAINDPAFAKDIGATADDGKPIAVSEGGGLYDPHTKTWLQRPGGKVEYKTVDLYDDSGTKIGEQVRRFGGAGGGAGTSQPASGKAPSAGVVSGGQLDPKAFFRDFVAPHEGGYNPHDANGAPVNFGINQAANPEVDVKNLTADGAADVFASKYATTKNMPPALAAVYNDTNFMSNPKLAPQLLQASGGDVNKFMAMRRSYQASLIKKDPDRYGKYANSWATRNADLASYVQQLGGGAAPDGAAPGGASSGDGGAEGTVVYDSTAGRSIKATPLLTPEEINYYGEQVANGGEMPTLGMGKEAAKVRRQILAQAADININRNISGTQGNLLKADLRANTRSLTDLTKLRTNVEASERTASLNMDQVLRLAPKGVAGGVPLFNKWIQAGRRAVPGDADLAALDTSMTTAANEYAAVMTRQSGSGAPTSDTARAEAHRLLHDAQNLGQISSTIRQMKIDMANRKHSLSEQDQILRGNIMAGAGSAIPGAAGGRAVAPAPTTTPHVGGGLVRISGDADYAKLASGTRFIGPDGKPRTKP